MLFPSLRRHTCRKAAVQEPDVEVPVSGCASGLEGPAAGVRACPEENSRALRDAGEAHLTVADGIVRSLDTRPANGCRRSSHPCRPSASGRTRKLGLRGDLHSLARRGLLLVDPRRSAFPIAAIPHLVSPTASGSSRRGIEATAGQHA